MLSSSKIVDPVVREVPVFMSKSLAGQLYIIQHQLTPASVPLEEANVLKAKIKPAQDKIQVTVEIDTDTRYDLAKGENFARQAIGPPHSGNEEPDERPMLYEQILESIPRPKTEVCPGYVVGVIRGGQLHLVPLKTIVQLHNKLTYLDQADVEKKRNKGNTSDAEDEPEKEATKVTLKFTQSRNQTGGKPRNAKGHDAYRKRMDDEPWTELSFHNQDNLEFSKLFSTVGRDTVNPFYVIKRQEYRRERFPPHSKINIISDKKSRKSSPRLTTNQLKGLSLAEQLKSLMQNAKVLQFSSVLQFLNLKLREPVDQVSALRSLQTTAVLVQGCWVVKSDIIYPFEHVSNWNGLSGSSMQKGRDIILAAFLENRIVTRAKMCELSHLPMEEVTQILSNVARSIRQVGWEFMLPFDGIFIRSHPEVVQRQSMIWESKRNCRKQHEAKVKEEVEVFHPPASVPMRRNSRNKSSDYDSTGDYSGIQPHRKRTNSRSGSDTA